MSTMAGSENISNNSNKPQTPQCKYFVVRKKRLCRMTVRPGRQYCGEHEPQPNSEENQVDKRIPCPNDPKHTCYARKLEKHLLVCNARPQELPPYIVPNINSPQELEKSPASKILLKDVPQKILDGVINKINELYNKHLLDKIVTVREQPAHPSVLKEFSEPERTERSRRHLRQVSSLLWLAESEGLVRPDTCYVELGAGKGQVSYYAFGAWCGERGGRPAAGEGGSRVLLLDRASHRHKRDNKLRDVQHDDGGVESVSRVRADLADVCLARVPAVDACRRALGLAKHLCGVATDYALRCMTGEGMQQKTCGLLVATCCHHRCERAAYVGREYLQEIGITKEVFSVMLGLVSWATCGDGRARHSRRGHDSNTNDTHDTHHNTSEESANDSYGVDNDQNVPYAPETDKHDAQQQDTHNKKRRRHSDGAAPNEPNVAPEPDKQEQQDAMSVDEEDYDSLDDYVGDDDHEPNDNADGAVGNNANEPDDDSDDEIPAEIRRQYPRGHFRSDPAARRALLRQLQQAPVVGAMLVGDPELRKFVDEKFGQLVKKKLTREEREEVGRRAKALLDWGRLMFLRRRGFRAKLCYYVPTSVSPENMCIVAKKI